MNGVCNDNFHKGTCYPGLHQQVLVAALNCFYGGWFRSSDLPSDMDGGKKEESTVKESKKGQEGGSVHN